MPSSPSGRPTFPASYVVNPAGSGGGLNRYGILAASLRVREDGVVPKKIHPAVRKRAVRLARKHHSALTASGYRRPRTAQVRDHPSWSGSWSESWHERARRTSPRPPALNPSSSPAAVMQHQAEAVQ